MFFLIDALIPYTPGYTYTEDILNLFGQKAVFLLAGL